MEQYLIWAIVIVAALIILPLVAVDIYHRIERRNHRARGMRRTDKIQL